MQLYRQNCGVSFPGKKRYVKVYHGSTLLALKGVTRKKAYVNMVPKVPMIEAAHPSSFKNVHIVFSVISAMLISLPSKRSRNENLTH